MLLLFFQYINCNCSQQRYRHFVWDFSFFKTSSNWEELCYKYYSSVDSVRWMQKTWDSLEGKIDRERFLY
ncbi:MAG: hypothetical protein GH151_12915 [Bacteroidetes bacterium]|nr:hypothetical protein [Bacteroidota bacterium]